MDPFITCKELIDFLGDYLESGLAPPQRREFDRHLAVCPSCINYVESYKATILLGKAAFDCPDDAPPPEVPAELIAAILAARRKAGG